MRNPRAKLSTGSIVNPEGPLGRRLVAQDQELVYQAAQRRRYLWKIRHTHEWWNIRQSVESPISR